MKKAFTLAETLIVIGIIGIIAVLVIPAFLNNYMRKTCATQLKMTVGQINKAIQTVIEEEKSNEDQDGGAFENVDINQNGSAINGFYSTKAGQAESSADSGVQYFLENYFKHTNYSGYCSNNEAENTDICKISHRNKANNKTFNITAPKDYYCIQTMDGAVICMYQHVSNDDDKRYTRILVDVNGAQKPNIIGLDTFSMFIDDAGRIADYAKKSPSNKNCSEYKNGANILMVAAGCFEKVVNDGWQILD